MGKDGPLCMNMYKFMFNTTRIPDRKRDHWAIYQDDPGAFLPSRLPSFSPSPFSLSRGETTGAGYP